MLNPSFTRTEAEAMQKEAGLDAVMILGYRSKKSKFGEYDDTLAIISPNGYMEFKANTLPSVNKNGIAVLQPGTYKYKQGLHGINHVSANTSFDQKVLAWLSQNKPKDVPPSLNPAGVLLPYYAFRQAGPVTLFRIGATKTETEADPAKYPFIDIHHGGWNLTSSEGCQTIFPDKWDIFRLRGYANMNAYGQDSILYHLVLVD